MATEPRSRTELGRFRRIAEIGRGGMAEVHLAHAQGPNGFHKLVVLKLVREHLAEDPDARAMLMDEARLAGRLNHPNVVQTLEVTEVEGSPVIVMEYLEGQSFSALLRRSRARGTPLALASSLQIICEALQGLHYAHQLKNFDGTPLRLVHRDVSPHNIFVTYEGRIKVLDFGIAKAAITQSETRAGVLKGKVAYMAPEQALGKPVDHRADLYAMGSVLWQVATGRSLWKDLPEGQALCHVVQGQVPAPSSVSPDVDPRLEAICMRALATDPEDRYPDALSLANELEALLDSMGGRPSTRTLGAQVAEMFEDVREETQKVIEAQLKELAGETTGEQRIPTLLASGGWNRTTTGPEVKLEEGASLSTGNSRGRGSSVSAVVAVNDEPAPPKRNTRVFALLAGAVVLAAVAGVWFYPKTEVQSVAASGVEAPPVAAVLPAAASDTAEETKKAALAISVTPETARIFVDDREVTQRPAEAMFDKPGTPHIVRAEADGYQSQRVEVVAGAQKSLYLQLVETPKASSAIAVAQRGARPARPEAPKAEAEQPAAVAESVPAPAGVPDTARDRIKNLDTSNPWGQVVKR
jgi:tRNA A-37 threonylcarbamoyl transferase component Bud32